MSSKLDSLADIYTPICMAALFAMFWKINQLFGRRRDVLGYACQVAQLIDDDPIGLGLRRLAGKDVAVALDHLVEDTSHAVALFVATWKRGI